MGQYSKRGTTQLTRSFRKLSQSSIKYSYSCTFPAERWNFHSRAVVLYQKNPAEMQQLLNSAFDKGFARLAGDSWTADAMQLRSSSREQHPEFKLNIPVILISSGLLWEDQQVFAEARNQRERESALLLLHKETKLEHFHGVMLMETSDRRRRRRREQLCHYTWDIGRRFQRSCVQN